jgi:transcriptional regulator with XRE-family HTH domain
MSENDNKRRLMSIGQRVKSAREDMNLTQEQFADKFAYARTTLAKLEAGLRDFKSTEIITLAEQLDVSCDYLLGRSRAAAPDNFLQEVVTRYGLSEQALQELSATMNLANRYNQGKVIDNGFNQFLDALNVLICNQSCYPVISVIWKLIFAPVSGMKITEPPLAVPDEWSDANVNENGNGGERALSETEAVNYRLLQLNEWLLKLRGTLTREG